jgi:hypothetical protein
VTTVPVRPAAYVRDIHADPDDDHGLPEYRAFMVSCAEGLGWPEPVVYADAGPSAGPGSEYAALVEAIAAGRHDAVVVPSAMVIGDMDEVEALVKLCRSHGVRLCSRWGEDVARAPRMQFDVVTNAKRFTVTDEHLRLLRRAHVSWDNTEFGAPEISCKRPYGNSYVLRDIAEILEIPDSEWADENEEILPEYEQRFLRLHVETAVALQIALSTGEFRTGSYTREDWSHGWKRDEPVRRGP